jgi:hypothetical protein
LSTVFMGVVYKELVQENLAPESFEKDEVQ